ncbi:HTH-type transcriptional repressor CytR [Thalassovita autumnalis]|uniref:HTH-type transcriptional repressor CytR n=1 Tax=Thalassovita autumnalis TaxID=2072972 RepID=A0A0P1FL18_9RHOB|nr:LacI family DNA-binding transcriptional regulator [Thalassovita autumnalis]CUH68908.1 HTH-type transcriptional repressor CytR [Thalassovita autumnalis]CUH71440.1 HTH-type transcriptional repressor CytR [Thalassovita autumnalis]
MTQKPATIQDVARQAEVSTATVSRALSNPNLVSEKTRELVAEAVRITGYRLNKAARNLRKQQAGAVLVLTPNLGNPFFSQILAGISARFADSEFSVLVADTSLPEQDGRRLVDYFLDSRIDGMISLDGGLSADQLAEFEQNGVADRIVFACEWVQDAPHPSVRSDNAFGARAVIRHLYDLGHRKIAHITGPKGNVLTRIRRETMLEERNRLGLPTREDWVIRGDFSLESGHAAAAKIAAMAERPTAVFCASDMVAIGLISGLREAGLSVPEDVSVVGFDDIEMAAFASPPLTTIRQDRRTLGTRAADRLLARLKGKPADACPQIELVDVELIARGSTAPPRDA